MMKRALNILSWAFLIFSAICFISIFVFVFIGDSDKGFIGLILGWTSYILAIGIKKFSEILNIK